LEGNRDQIGGGHYPRMHIILNKMWYLVTSRVLLRTSQVFRFLIVVPGLEDFCLFPLS